MSKEQLNKNDIWNPYFYKDFPGFSCIEPLLIKMGHLTSWPLLEDYNTLAGKYFPLNDSLAQIRFVSQRPGMQYEWEIYHHHAVPTRENLWHDFFNNLSWIAFTQLKWALIKRTCEEKQNQQGKSRTALQNLLAHFDECGLVVCTDSQQIIDKIKAFQWKELFCQTPNLQRHCLPIIVGHGLMAKGLSPYIGMTAKAIILKVESAFFTLTTLMQNRKIDENVARYIESEDFPHDPQVLHPFPLLGWPKWYPNQSANFYDNACYFREKIKCNAQLKFAALTTCEGKSL